MYTTLLSKNQSWTLLKSLVYFFLLFQWHSYAGRATMNHLDISTSRILQLGSCHWHKSKIVDSAASRCILVQFEPYKRQKNSPKKVLVTLFPYIFHVKTKWNIVYEYLKTKISSRDTNIFPQMHWISNIFGPSAKTIGRFGVSRNDPILNFKKTVCLKNFRMRHREKT